MSEAHIKIQKRKILKALEKVYPCDLCLSEITEKVDILSPITVSKYVSELKGEGRIEVSRRVGKIPFYRIKKK